SGREIFWIGIVNGEPEVRVVNPLRFDYDNSPDNDYIEDSEWAVAEFRMTPSEVISMFGDELTTTEIDEIYNGNNYLGEGQNLDFSFDTSDIDDGGYTIRVLHATWTSLTKIGFLYGINQETGEVYEDIVDESYE